MYNESFELNFSAKKKNAAENFAVYLGLIPIE